MKKESRRDQKRKRIDAPCSILFKDRVFRGRLVEVSPGGCRVQQAEDLLLALGTTVDIAADIAGQSVLITGSVINMSANGIGVTILAIGDHSRRLLQRLLEGASLPEDKRNPVKPPRRILALGAGGGKILGQLKMLELLERALGGPVVSHFDMFAGSSSGALVLALLASGSSVKEAREMVVSGITRLGFSSLFLVNNLLDKGTLHRAIDRHFGHRLLRDLKTPLFTISRNFSSSIHTHYSFWDDGDRSIASVLKRASAIPVLLGAHENEMDGGAGLFVNPVELLLRALRHGGLLSENLNIFYLDAGLDPLGPGERMPVLRDNVLSQLFWLIGTMLRDLNILATDRIQSEFPLVRYLPYFFTFSRQYDVSKSTDFYDAEAEVENRAHAFLEWFEQQAPGTM